MPRVFSGIQPTGSLHLGNYLGAVRNWVALQDHADYDCLYCVVDYHAITIDYSPAELAERTVEMTRDLLACGLDPERSILFAQSHVREHTELAWVFQATSTAYGELQRMTQFKGKADQQGFVTAGLFTYPVLQAADILLYDGERVPVGEDQVQHLELTREIARRFNNRFGETFPETEALLTQAPKILSFRDPDSKMSKSAGEGHYLPFDAAEKPARKMIKSAVTDTGSPEPGAMSPGVANLFLILRELGATELHQELLAEYETGTPMYGKLKGATADTVWSVIAEIQERKETFTVAKTREILAAGAEKARPLARAKMDEVRSRIGLAPE